MDWNIAQAIGTWVGSLGAIGALIFFAIQTRSLAKQTKSLVAQTQAMTTSYAFDSQWRRDNKSSELAILYAQSLLPRISYCSLVIQKTDIYKQLKSIDPKRMVRFNQTELKEIFGTNENVYELAKESVAKVDIKHFINQRPMIPPEFRNEVIERLISSNKCNPTTIGLWHAAAEDEFWSVAETLLNDLEYFSMCINSRVADGDILYPSLHQTFFSTISAFYFLIAHQNTSMKDKYYTHIIQLYKSWRERFFEHERKEHQAEEEISQQYNMVP